MIEVFEPGSEDERMAMEILALAKNFHENMQGGAEPMAFIFADDSHGICPLGQFGDYNRPDVRDKACEFLREHCKEAKATSIAIVSDTWLTKFRDPAGARAAGLDISRYREWSAADEQRFLLRREALAVMLETSTARALIHQYYRRTPDIAWEEFEILRGEELAGEGRFWGLLPKRD